MANPYEIIGYMEIKILSEKELFPFYEKHEC